MIVFFQFSEKKIGDRIEKVCGKAKLSLSVAQIIKVWPMFFFFNISLFFKISYFLSSLLLANDGL